MDIKEIALNVADSLRNKIDGISHMQSNQGLVRFAEALIAEVAKQNEPVCELVKADNGNYLVQKWAKDYVAMQGDKLYTFPSTAEQIANETAEACAKACEDVIGNTPHDQRMLAAIDCAVMLRSGAWKEFKK